MRARLQHAESPDVARVWDWVPSSPAEVCYSLRMTIGTGPADGAVFTALVATPEGLLARETTLGPVVHSRAVVVVLDYSWLAVTDYVEGVLDRCTGNSWEHIVIRLSRHFQPFSERLGPDSGPEGSEND